MFHGLAHTSAASDIKICCNISQDWAKEFLGSVSVDMLKKIGYTDKDVCHRTCTLVPFGDIRCKLTCQIIEQYNAQYNKFVCVSQHSVKTH